MPLSSVLVKLQTDVLDGLLYAEDKGKHVGSLRQKWKGQLVKFRGQIEQAKVYHLNEHFENGTQ